MWEYMELRAHSHPALLQALRKFKKYEEQIERNGPAVKNSGLLFFSHIGLARPEVVRYRKRMAQRYSPPSPAKILLLVPQARTKPFHKSPEFREYVQKAKRLLKESANRIHVCFYEAPFGVVPVEIDEVYPLSQHETAMPLDKETVDYVASEVANHIKRTRYERVVLFDDHETWNDAVLRACRNVCRRRKIKFQTVRVRKTNTDQDASKQSQTD
jgi:7-cyano-7-deazaguanine tRNA-ribosyltransferase